MTWHSGYTLVNPYHITHSPYHGLTSALSGVDVNLHQYTPTYSPGYYGWLTPAWHDLLISWYDCEASMSWVSDRISSSGHTHESMIAYAHINSWLNSDINSWSWRERTYTPESWVCMITWVDILISMAYQCHESVRPSAATPTIMSPW